LAAYPALTRCIAEKPPASKSAPDGEHELWLPVWLQDKVVACLEIRNEQALPRTRST
jgi:hypothetical protein